MAAEDDTTRRKTKTRYRCYPNLCIRLIGIVQIVVLYVLLVGHASAVDWHDTYGGMGTTHEQLGQVHYPEVELTPYTSKVEYTKEKKPNTWSVTPAYNISQFFFDSTINDKPPLPDGKSEYKCIHLSISFSLYDGQIRLFDCKEWRYLDNG